MNITDNQAKQNISAIDEIIQNLIILQDNGIQIIKSRKDDKVIYNLLESFNHSIIQLMLIDNLPIAYLKFIWKHIQNLYMQIVRANICYNPAIPLNYLLQLCNDIVFLTKHYQYAELLCPLIEQATNELKQNYMHTN